MCGMSDFWKEFGESDPTRKPAPEWYFWPGVVLVAICAVFVVFKVASLYSR